MVSEDVRDELDAIEAIYPECVTRLNEGLIDLKVPQHEEYVLRVSLGDRYPSTEPPHILQVRCGSRDDNYLQVLLTEVLGSVFQPGSVCLFEFLGELEGVLYAEDDHDEAVPEEPTEQADSVDVLDGWVASDPVVDRGSTFIAFARLVDNEEELRQKLALLKTERKISRATHNMVAYRIQKKDGTRISDCDDDGESAAGGRMLHLLQIMDVWNVIVVVSRWFGGTHLGPDRFKHINSTTREAVIRAGLLDEKIAKKKR